MNDDEIALFWRVQKRVDDGMCLPDAWEAEDVTEGVWKRIRREMVAAGLFQHVHINAARTAARRAKREALVPQIQMMLNQRIVIPEICRRLGITEKDYQALRDDKKVKALPVLPPTQFWTEASRAKLATVAARLKEETDARAREAAPALQALFDKRVSVADALSQTGVTGFLYRRMRKMGLVRPPRSIPPIRVSKKPAPVRATAVMARGGAAPVRVAIQAQSVEEWLAAGGQIKRLPVAAVAATTAKVPEEARDELARYRKQVGGYGYVKGWKQAHRNFMGARK